MDLPILPRGEWHPLCPFPMQEEPIEPSSLKEEPREPSPVQEDSIEPSWRDRKKERAISAGLLRNPATGRLESYEILADKNEATRGAGVGLPPWLDDVQELPQKAPEKRSCFKWLFECLKDLFSRIFCCYQETNSEKKEKRDSDPLIPRDEAIVPWIPEPPSMMTPVWQEYDPGLFKDEGANKEPEPIRPLKETWTPFVLTTTTNMSVHSEDVANNTNAIHEKELMLTMMDS